MTTLAARDGNVLSIALRMRSVTESQLVVIIPFVEPVALSGGTPRRTSWSHIDYSDPHWRPKPRPRSVRKPALLTKRKPPVPVLVGITQEDLLLLQANDILDSEEMMALLELVH